MGVSTIKEEDLILFPDMLGCQSRETLTLKTVVVWEVTVVLPRVEGITMESMERDLRQNLKLVENL